MTFKKWPRAGKKWPRAERILLSLGLLLVTLPFLLKEYIHLPDFLRGALEGVGIGFEIVAIIRMKKRTRDEPACKGQAN